MVVSGSESDSAGDGEQRGPWARYSTEQLLHRRFFSVQSDRVRTPGGSDGLYDWVQAPDLVRVAALTSADELYIVRQYHYLPHKVMWQLPGGGIDADEDPAAAAARELHEETGLIAGTWREFGAVWPMPGLSSARVHLWLARDLDGGGEAHPEESEADLIAQRVPLARAVEAALDGTIGCAASAQLVLAVATVL